MGRQARENEPRHPLRPAIGSASRGRPKTPERSLGSLVVVATPDAGARNRWRRALAGDYVVHEIGAETGVLARIDSLAPAVAIIDLAYRDGGEVLDPRGLRLTSATRLILLDQDPNGTEAATWLRGGARGYCSRDIDAFLLRKAVQMVQKGEFWVSRDVMPHLLHSNGSSGSQTNGHRHDSSELLKSLSPREAEIAALVHQGASNKEIAAELDVTEPTVKAHLTAVYRKLGVTSRVQLALAMARESHDPAAASPSGPE